MHAGGGVFELLRPCARNSVILSFRYIVGNGPFEFFQLFRGQQLPRFRKRNPVSRGETPIPDFYLRVDFLYSALVLRFEILYVAVALIE